MASGKLRAAFAWPTYIDPAVGSDESSKIAMSNLYDTLVFPDTNGNPLPHVAESWEISPDGLIWTFYLRSGVKFHDGSELTAEDVKFSMDRLLTIGEGLAYLFTGKIKETVVADKYTVVFHTEKPFGPFLSTLFNLYIVNKEQVMANIKKTGLYGEDLGDYGKDYLLTQDVGSGAYMVKEFPLEEYLLMSKNPNYWLDIDPNAPDEFKMIGVTEPMTIRTMMSRRELEISDKWASAETLQALSEIKGVNLASFPAGSMYYLSINTKEPPTDDIHFRKAMAWAFDYDTAVKLFPGATRAQGPTSSIAGFNPNAFTYHQDLDKAMEELMQSKYYNDLDKYTVELFWTSEVPDQEKIALLIMSNMSKLGIKLKPIKTPWLSVVESASSLETSPHIISLFCGARYPEVSSQLEGRYHSSSVKTYLQNEWLLDPVLDKMIEDAIATIDRDKRFNKYHEVIKYVMELCPSIFVLDYANNYAYQSEYVDWYSAQGDDIPVFGYQLVARFIKVFPEKRVELLK